MNSSAETTTTQHHQEEGTCIPSLSWTTPLDSVLSVTTTSAVDTTTPLYTPPQQQQQQQHSCTFICHWDHCGQVLPSLRALSVHLDTEHIERGQSSYSCQWIDCARHGRPLTKRHKLLSHLRTHTGDKPFVCQTCAKPFSRRDSLVSHTRQHLRRADVVMDAEVGEDNGQARTLMLPPPRKESLVLPPRSDSLQHCQPAPLPRRRDSLHVPLLVPAPIDTSLCQYLDLDMDLPVPMEEEEDDVDWNGLMYPLSPMTNNTDDTSNDGSTLVEFLSPTLTYFDAMDTETTWTSPEQFCLSVKQQEFHDYNDNMFDIYMQTC